MTLQLMTWTIIFISANIIFVLTCFTSTPLSFYSHYTDTAFLIATFVLTALTVRKRIKKKINSSQDYLSFTCCRSAFLFTATWILINGGLYITVQ